MKQSLSHVVDVRKSALREKLFSRLGYDLVASRAKDRDGTELGEELRSQIS